VSAAVPVPAVGAPISLGGAWSYLTDPEARLDHETALQAIGAPAPRRVMRVPTNW
jgi:hypothetical protein